MNIKPNPIMELQDTEGLENRMGYWLKKKTLDEKIKDSDLDNDLKKEIIENLKGETKWQQLKRIYIAPMRSRISPK